MNRAMDDDCTHIDNLMARQRFPLAMEQIVQGLSRAPNSPELYLRMAIALSGMSKEQEAEKAAREAIRLAPEDGRMYNTLASTLRWQERYEEAEQAINEAHRLEPNRAYFFGKHVAISWGLKREEEAMGHAMQAIALEPDDAWHHLLAAQCAQRLKRSEAVLTHCRESLRLDPQSITTLTLYGTTLQKLGRHREAVPPLLSAMRMNPCDSGIHEMLLESMQFRNRLIRWLPLRSLLTRTMLESEWIVWVYMSLWMFIPAAVITVLSFMPEPIQKQYIFLMPTTYALGGILLLLRMMVRFSLVAVLQFDREARSLLRVKDRLAANAAFALPVVIAMSVLIFIHHNAKVGMGLVFALASGAFILCLLFALRPSRSRRRLAILLPVLLAALIGSIYFEMNVRDASPGTVPLTIAMLTSCAAGATVRQEDWC
jgi:tetratricopeptide (TPR) repeat protein